MRLTGCIANYLRAISPRFSNLITKLMCCIYWFNTQNHVVISLYVCNSQLGMHAYRIVYPVTMLLLSAT